MQIAYKPTFLKQLEKLGAPLQEEVYEKVELLKEKKNHKYLRVHKLHGHLEKIWSFSVNYKYRIVFEWVDKKTIFLLAIGDHSVYN